MCEDYQEYGDFANVYDAFMDNIPYQEWHSYLKSLLDSHGVSEGIVVDLGCGTGTMTQMLAEDGYDMIGVDRSAEMLLQARAKCDSQILFLEQDMRELDLYGSARAMVCICDGMNYLLSQEDILQTFNRVHTFLDSGGIFIFDLKTPHFYEHVLGNRTIAENREQASMIWENEYHNDTGKHEYLLTFYQCIDEQKDYYARFEEYHQQRSYSKESILSLMKKAGFIQLEGYQAFSTQMAGDEDERWYFVAQKA